MRFTRRVGGGERREAAEWTGSAMIMGGERSGSASEDLVRGEAPVSACLSPDTIPGRCRVTLPGLARVAAAALPGMTKGLSSSTITTGLDDEILST